jgi:hypothetical protein
MKCMRLIDELRRRHVFRSAVAYLAAAWLLIQVLETLFPIFGLSETSIRVVVVVLAVGFTPAMVLSWVFEWTPEGFRRDAEITQPASRHGRPRSRFGTRMLLSRKSPTRSMSTTLSRVPCAASRIASASPCNCSTARLTRRAIDVSD